MSFTAIAWLAVGLNFVASVLLITRPWRKPPEPFEPEPITLSDALRPVLLAGALLGLFRLTGLSRSPFGIIHLLYLHLVVLAPAMGLLALILAAWRRNGRRPFAVSRGVKVLAVLTLAAIPVGIYATFIEPFRLKLETATLAPRDGRDPGGEIRIAVLADIQTDDVGEHERRAIDLALAQHPDIVLLPGDLWQSEREPTSKDITALRELLGRLSVPGGAWFAPGNCDSPRWIEELLTGTPVAMLHNRIVRTHVQGRQVTIGGVELQHTDAAAAIIRDLEAAPGSSDLRILLAHYPDNIEYLKTDSRIDLLVAGHTHGGQIVIPGLGPLMTLSNVPRTVAAGGLHRLDGNAIYVSRGVGCERGKAPRIRFFCPPEVSLLTIPASTAPTGAATAAAPIKADSNRGFRLLTWNIQGCAGGLDPVLDELRRQNADVICLQEAEVGTDHTGGADQPALIAEKLGLHQIAAGSSFASGGGKQLMAILARRPLEHPEPLDAGTGRIYGVTGVARIDDRPVRVASIHLTNRYWRGLKSALNSDNAPIQEAADLARRLKTWNEPVVVAGDFNAVPTMREHTLIAEHLKRVPTTQPTFPPDKPILAVDHVYHSAGLRPVQLQVVDSKASDHRPVKVGFVGESVPPSAPAGNR